MGTKVRTAAIAGVIGCGMLQGLCSTAEAHAVVAEVSVAQRGTPWQNLGYAWWGIGGLLGLLGLVGLTRLRRRTGTASSRDTGDPFARYPSMNQHCAPNANAAHTPLMIPRVTPEMVTHVPHRQPQREVTPRQSAPEGNPTGPAECSGTQSGTLFPSPEKPSVPAQVQRPAEQPVEDEKGNTAGKNPDTVGDVVPETDTTTGSGSHRKRSPRETFLANVAKAAATLPRAGLERARGLLHRREKSGN